MDTPASSSSRRPELKLNGRRPTLLKVRKSPHKISKPLVAPPHHNHPPPPIIIYTESPKTIHTNPNEFKSLVQRLTGPDSSSPPCTNSAFAFQENGGGISTAAREILSTPQNSFPILSHMMITPSANELDILSAWFDI